MSLLAQRAENCLKLVKAATDSSYGPIKRSFMVLRRAQIAKKMTGMTKFGLGEARLPQMANNRPGKPKWPWVTHVTKIFFKFTS